MIWILGGTHETRELLENLDSYDDIIVTVTTEEAREMLPSDVKVRVGALTYEEKLEFVRTNRITLIIDMTHPFARRISKSIREFSEEENIRLLRFVRRDSLDTFNKEGIYIFSGYEETKNFLKTIKGTVLFTTGSKYAEEFLSIRGENRFIFRILPTVKSIESLSGYGLDMKDIIAMVGPFSKEMNQQLIREFKVDYLVTKDSGYGSGTSEKIEAAKEMGIKAVVIKREEERGIDSLFAIENIIKETRSVK